MTSAIALTFHAVENDICLDDARSRYTITEEMLKEIACEASSMKCCNVEEYSRKKEGDWVIFTFDDGFESDFRVAFPLIERNGLSATFYVNANNIGTPGYLSKEQLRRMADAKMGIGSHGMSHRYLVSMTQKEARHQISCSKDTLEQLVGREVSSFAPVGGHYRSWMVDYCRDKGYSSFATMIPGMTRGGGSFVSLRRNHILAHYTIRESRKLLSGQRYSMLKKRAEYQLLCVPKMILGMTNYDRLKKRILTP